MKIICISGTAQSGKDTSAEIIRKMLWGDGKRVLIIHNADLLKFVCRQLFGWDGRKDEYGRSLLQTVGTESIRAQNPDYWVGFIAQMLQFFPDKWDFVLIPDCRFPNEITLLKKQGYDVTHIKLVRDNYDNGLTEEQRAHSSETLIESMNPDITIDNDGTLVDLTRKLMGIVRNLLKQEEGNTTWMPEK